MPLFARFKYSKLALVFGLLSALYAVGGFFLAPLILRPVIEENLTNAINGRAFIESLHINPFSLSIAAGNIRIEDRSQKTLLSARELQLNLEARSLYEGAYTFKSIHLIEPQLRLGHLKDGRLNFASLVRKESPTPQPPREPGKPPRFILDEATIERGTVQYFDEQRKDSIELKLSSLKLNLVDFSSAGGNESKFGIYVQNTFANTAAVTGTVQLSPLRISGNMAVQVGEPGPIFNYLASNLNLVPARGKIHMVGDYTFDMGSENADLALDTSTFTISDLELITNGSADRLARIGSLSLDLVLSLKDRTLKMTDLKIDSGDINIVRETDGRLNIGTIVNEPASPAPEQSDRGWEISLRNASLSGFDINYADRSLPGYQAAVRGLTIALRSFSTGGESSVDADVEARIPAEGSVKAKISGKTNPANLLVDLNLEKIPLSTIPPHLTSTLNQGSGNLKGTLRIKGGEAPGVTFGGEASVRDLTVKDPSDKSQILGVRGVRANGINFTDTPAKLQIDHVLLDSPELSLSVDKDGKFRYPAKAEAPASAGANAPPAEKFVYNLNEVTISNGVLQYRDESLPSPFRTQMSAIKAGASGVSNRDNARMKLELKALVDRQGKLIYKGELVPSSAFPLQNAELILENIDMLAFSPYSMKYLGRKIEGGKLHLTISNKITGDDVTGDNQFVFDRLYLAQQTGESVTSLPIGTALSVLRDSQGQIKLSFPVSGNVNAPGYSYRKLLIKSLEDLVMTVATSPFSMLASIYNVSSEELSHVDFPPGEYKLPESEVEKINVIRKALTDRPALRLELRGGSNIVADGGDPQDTTLDEVLFELAADRASSIRDSILEGSSIEPGRIYMLAPIVTGLNDDNTISSTLSLRSD